MLWLLHIQRQFNTVIRDFGPVKGKKPRYVPCNSILRDELKRLIQKDRLSHDQTFFHTETGTPIDHDNFTDRYFEKDVAGAGVKRIRFHDLRHTGTTLMIAGGLDVKTVKEICGHIDISTTMRYVHLLGDSIRNVARTYSVTPSAESPKLHLVQKSG